MRILISVGEASGDRYGAQLIEALRRHAPAIEVFGAGGPAMRVVGCDTVVDARDLAVVGISEILTHLPKIYGLFHRLIREADRRRPDVCIVIDSPAFNWRIAREMHKRKIPVVYYVCPQFWAWRQGRTRLLRKYVDRALVIFPFEEKFYRDRGVNAKFVGHPLSDVPLPTVTRADYAGENNLDPSKPWITLMPGSRVKEVRMNLPAILSSAAKLGGSYEFLLPVAQTLDRGFLQKLIGAGTIRLVSEARPALAHSRAGLIASGTATVEAAMMGTPFVMVYRVSKLTYLLGRKRVKVPYFAMVNLIAGKEIVPELVQEDFTAERAIEKLSPALAEGPVREQMIAGLAEVRAKLSHHAHPADLAADEVLSLVTGGNY